MHIVFIRSRSRNEENHWNCSEHVVRFRPLFTFSFNFPGYFSAHAPCVCPGWKFPVMFYHGVTTYGEDTIKKKWSPDVNLGLKVAKHEAKAVAIRPWYSRIHTIGGRKHWRFRCHWYIHWCYEITELWQHWVAWQWKPGWRLAMQRSAGTYSVKVTDQWSRLGSIHTFLFIGVVR